MRAFWGTQNRKGGNHAWQDAGWPRKTIQYLVKRKNDQTNKGKGENNMIIKVTTYKGTSTIEAAGISGPMAFMGGTAWKLQGPVKVNGNEVPMGTINFDGIADVDINGVADRGEARLQVDIFDILFWVKKASPYGLTAIKESDVMESKEALSAIHGSFGPFDYSIDVNIDTSDYMKSYFYVDLSIWGIHLISAHLDASNPKVSIDASILGAGIKGTLGVDFNQCRVYVEVEIKYIVGSKTYSFDIYNWSNCKMEYLPAEEGAKCMLSAADGMSGYINVYNTGAYVAKFTLEYTVNGVRMTRESDKITAGVTKTLDIPADATDITLHVLDEVFINVWSTIFSQHFDTPVCKSYHVWGTTLITEWEEC